MTGHTRGDRDSAKDLLCCHIALSEKIGGSDFCQETYSSWSVHHHANVCKGNLPTKIRTLNLISEG
jgi:hypothetical protein